MPLRLPSPDNRAGSPNTGLLSPSWTRTRRPTDGTVNHPYSQSESMALRDKVINNAERIQRKITATIKKLTLVQKILLGILVLVGFVVGVLFLVYNEKIFHSLAPLAAKWKDTTGGWIILWSLIFMAAFPPLIGYSTCGTLAGFVYGIGEGWVILSTATIAGSFCSFILSRTVLRSYVERMVANDKRFAALSLTLKHDGLKLLCMIRLCPLPYSISNGAMSTFPTVHPGMYALATALITPKLFIHVIVGSRLAVIARTGEKMSTSTRVINWVGIAFGLALGSFTGWWIYRKTMARARQLEEEEAQNVQDSVRRTGAPPRRFSDDPEAQIAAETLAQDDDNIDYFDDAPSPRPLYTDENGDEEDVFSRGDGHGDGGKDGSIGLGKHQN